MSPPQPPSFLDAPTGAASTHLESPGGRGSLLSTVGFRDANCPIERWEPLESGWVLWLFEQQKKGGSDQGHFYFWFVGTFSGSPELPCKKSKFLETAWKSSHV